MKLEDFILLLYALSNSDTLPGKIIIISHIAGIAVVIVLVILQIILAVKNYTDRIKARRKRP